MSNDNFSTDEVRRQLRVVDRANDAVMPRWREALERIMGGDEKLSTDQKAAILGVPNPSRRNFFRIGGVTILGAAVLAACGSDDDDTASTTPGTNAPAGTTPPTTPATTPDTMPMTTEPASANMDLTLAKTAASLEKLAVDVYGQAGALLSTPAVISAATMFAGHHQMHLDALNGVITGTGAAPITQMNQAVYDALVAPALSSAATEADAVNLALALEEAAAQTYAFAGRRTLDARAAFDDHDDRWRRGPPRGSAADGRAGAATGRRVPGRPGLLPRRQPPRRHRRRPHQLTSCGGWQCTIGQPLRPSWLVTLCGSGAVGAVQVRPDRDTDLITCSLHGEDRRARRRLVDQERKPPRGDVDHRSRQRRRIVRAGLDSVTDDRSPRGCRVGR